MNEEKKKKITINGEGKISIELKPKKIVTVRISPQEMKEVYPAVEK